MRSRPKPTDGGPWALAATAANRRAVHHHAASAAVLQHARHALAARLNHLATLRVAAGATNAHAVLGHVAFAHAHGQVARANHHTVHHHGATAHAAGQHFAEILHHAAGHFVIAGAHDLHPAAALFHLDRASKRASMPSHPCWNETCWEFGTKTRRFGPVIYFPSCLA